MLLFKILILVFLLIVILYNPLFSQDTNAITVPDDPDIIFNQGLKELQEGNISTAITLLE